MKLQVVDGEIVLADVFNGIGIQTDMGIFAIAQRDSGVEVMLNGKSVWSSNDLPEAPQEKPTFHETVAASISLARATITQELAALHNLFGSEARERAKSLQRALLSVDGARNLLDECFYLEHPEAHVSQSPYYKR